MNLTFGEQVKIVLGRKGMTIKQLAEEVEKYTGKPMSRQNMTQRLGRDNFQEQDMRMIAEILGCDFTLSILETNRIVAEEEEVVTRDITVGELIEETPVSDEPLKEEVQVEKETTSSYEDQREKEKELLRRGIKGYFSKGSSEKKTEEAVVGEINPYTQKEYESNSVRMHPKKIGYVQVYDREQHGWTDMTEWAFLGYQERKKQLLGKDYRPPVYLD